MSLRRNVIQGYLENEKIKYIIGHSVRKYFNILIFTVLLLVTFFLIFYGLQKYVSSSFVEIGKWLLAISGIVVYLKFVLDFLDIYLDSLILTDRGITMFRWDNIFSYTSENIGREYIQTVYDEQNGFLDVILGKGDLNVKIHSGDYKFDEVPNPARQTNIISSTKDSMSFYNNEQQEGKDLDDKFDMLVDTLSDVIEDYLKNNKNKDNDDYYY